MSFIFLGLGVIAAVLLLSRWMAHANPAALVKAARWALIVFVVLGLAGVAWIGRYQLAAYVLPFLIPAFIRWRLGRGPQGGPQGGPGGTGGGANEGRARRPGPGGMSRAEAYEILGLAPGADAEAVKEAHRRLMAKIHPDRGGSDYLAAKINQARDVLLGS